MTTGTIRRLSVLALSGAAFVPAPSHASTFAVSSGNWGVASNWINPANVPDTTAESAAVNSGLAVVEANYTISGLSLTGGTISGPGILTTGALFWGGGGAFGRTTSSGSTTITGAANLSAAANTEFRIYGRTVNFGGGTTMSVATPGYGMAITDNATVVNNGNFAVTDNSGIYGDNTASFINYGTFTKSGGTATSTLNYFYNNGTVSAISGTLAVSLDAGGMSNGTFNATGSNTLNVSTPGTHQLNAGAAFTGSGAIRLTGGAFVTSGTVTSTATNLTLAGATLYNNYNFANLNWTSGVVGSGTAMSITNNAVFTPAAGSSLALSGTLNLSGTTQLTGSPGNGLSVLAGATVNNSGTFQVTDDAGINYGGSASNFNNTGTLVKTGGTGTSVFYGLNNTGTLSVQTGTVQAYLKSTTDPTGTYTVNSGATLRLIGNSGPHTFGPGTLFNGLGRLRFVDNQANIQGTIQATGLTLEAADVNGNGSLAVIVSGPITNGPGFFGALGITKTGVGAVRFSGNNTYTGPTTVAGGTLDAFPAAFNNILTNAGGINLSAAGAKFAMGNFTTSPAATVKAILTSGYASNFASGQIRSSAANANLTLGYQDGGTFVIVMATVPGDANLDGRVDFNDFLTLQNSFGQTGTRWDRGDFNYSGTTDFNDFLVLQNHFGQSLPGLRAAAATGEQLAAMTAFASTVAVPEPAVGIAAGLLCVGVARRRMIRPARA